MGVRWVWLAIALSVKLQFCRSQCAGSMRHIAPGNGTIQSPNYGHEYGKTESCTWRTMKYPNSVTILRLTSLKIVPPTGGCDDSYVLTIGGEKVDCKMYIPRDDRSNSKCYAFPYKCKSIPDVGKCAIRNETARVIVRYVANGKKANFKLRPSYMHGFEMEYEIYGCQDNSEKGNEKSKVVTTRTTSRPNRERTNTNRNVHNRNRVAATSVSTTTRRETQNRNAARGTTITAAPSTGTTITNTTAKEDGQSSTIVVVIIPLVATIVIGIGIGIALFIRMKNKTRQNSNVGRHYDDVRVPVSRTYMNITSNTSQTVYHEVGTSPLPQTSRGSYNVSSSATAQVAMTLIETPGYQTVALNSDQAIIPQCAYDL